MNGWHSFTSRPSDCCELFPVQVRIKRCRVPNISHRGTPADRDPSKLADALKILNADFSPHDLYGRRPPDEGNRDEDE